MSDELERTGSMGDNLVDIKGLSVSFVTDAGPIKAIDGVDFTIPRKTVRSTFAPHRMGPRASMCSP